jgi:hypothetical protein
MHSYFHPCDVFQHPPIFSISSIQLKSCSNFIPMLNWIHPKSSSRIQLEHPRFNRLEKGPKEYSMLWVRRVVARMWRWTRISTQHLTRTDRTSSPPLPSALYNRGGRTNEPVQRGYSMCNNQTRVQRCLKVDPGFNRDRQYRPVSPATTGPSNLPESPPTDTLPGPKSLP